MSLPDRVLVYGVTGSGKSTAATRIAARAASADGPEVLLFRHPRELEAWLATFP